MSISPLSISQIGVLTIHQDEYLDTIQALAYILLFTYVFFPFIPIASVRCVHISMSFRVINTALCVVALHIFPSE